jgi:hypothetical protein
MILRWALNFWDCIIMRIVIRINEKATLEGGFRFYSTYITGNASFTFTL